MAQAVSELLPTDLLPRLLPAQREDKGANQVHGFSAMILPFLSIYIGVPYMRAIYRAFLPARRNARPAAIASGSVYLLFEFFIWISL